MLTKSHKSSYFQESSQQRDFNAGKSDTNFSAENDDGKVIDFRLSPSPQGMEIEVPNDTEILNPDGAVVNFKLGALSVRSRKNGLDAVRDVLSDRDDDSAIESLETFWDGLFDDEHELME